MAAWNGFYKERNSMAINSKKHRVGIVDFTLVDAGLSHLEALVFQYVQRFERNKRPCFASIPYIATELRLPERTTRRYIKRLIKLKFLRETTKGRGRYLNTNAARTTPIPVKMASMNAAKLAYDCGQIGQLPLEVPIEILPIKDTNTDPKLEKLNKACEKFGLKKRFQS